jgi:DNA topoisomerase VI subunit A
VRSSRWHAALLPGQLTLRCATSRIRLFLKKMKTDLRIPVLGLVDSDPYGLKILRHVHARSSSSVECDAFAKSSSAE